VRQYSFVKDAPTVLADAKQLAELADVLNIPMFVVDARGRLEHFNEAAATAVGQRFDEVGRADLHEQAALWDPRNVEGERIPLEHLPAMDALRRRRPVHRFLNISGAGGAQSRFEVSAFPVTDAQGELMGAVGFFWATSS
jgi:PAS domain-containing protein